MREDPQGFFEQGGWQDILRPPSDEEEDPADLDDEDFDDDDAFGVEDDDEDVSGNICLPYLVSSWLTFFSSRLNCCQDQIRASSVVMMRTKKTMRWMMRRALPIGTSWRKRPNRVGYSVISHSQPCLSNFFYRGFTTQEEAN